MHEAQKEKSLAYCPSFREILDTLVHRNPSGSCDIFFHKGSLGFLVSFLRVTIFRAMHIRIILIIFLFMPLFCGFC